MSLNVLSLLDKHSKETDVEFTRGILALTTHPEDVSRIPNLTAIAASSSLRHLILSWESVPRLDVPVIMPPKHLAGNFSVENRVLNGIMSIVAEYSHGDVAVFNTAVDLFRRYVRHGAHWYRARTLMHNQGDIALMESSIVCVHLAYGVLRSEETDNTGLFQQTVEYAYFTEVLEDEVTPATVDDVVARLSLREHDVLVANDNRMGTASMYDMFTALDAVVWNEPSFPNLQHEAKRSFLTMTEILLAFAVLIPGFSVKTPWTTAAAIVTLLSSFVYATQRDVDSVVTILAEVVNSAFGGEFSLESIAESIILRANAMQEAYNVFSSEERRKEAYASFQQNIIRPRTTGDTYSHAHEARTRSDFVRLKIFISTRPALTVPDITSPIAKKRKFIQ